MDSYWIILNKQKRVYISLSFIYFYKIILTKRIMWSYTLIYEQAVNNHTEFSHSCKISCLIHSLKPTESLVQVKRTTLARFLVMFRFIKKNQLIRMTHSGIKLHALLFQIYLGAEYRLNGHFVCLALYCKFICSAVEWLVRSTVLKNKVS